MEGVSFSLIMSSVLLGVGLAMDAFSVSLANGLNEPRMKFGRALGIAGTFSIYQFAMPMIGWVCVHAAAQKFSTFQKYIPWIALVLLLYIGGKMLIEGIRDARELKNAADAGESGSGTADAADAENGSVSGKAAANARTIADTAKKLSFAELMVQGVATSIDALSVGFTIAEYNAAAALISTIIIGAVTLVICMAGLELGRRWGTRLAGKASILGGIILIGIGLEIWLSGIL